MLGSQSWFTAFAIPTIVVGGFIASRKRFAYQWREELMDIEGTAYPTVTDADMAYFRRVAPAAAVEAFELLSTPLQQPSPGSADELALTSAAEEAMGVPLGTSDNIGVNVRGNVLPPELCNVLLNEVQRWTQTLGNAVDERKVTALEERLRASSAPTHLSSSPSTSETAELDFDFLRQVRVIADHAEDIQEMKAPWGSGDRMRQEEMPAALRYLARQTQAAFEGVGRLRHVYIEYSPTGEFFRAPRRPKMYDGHDYVIIPIRRDGADTVVTLSPALRSRMGGLREVALQSWTSRDVDALVPGGSMLRVYSSARYEWGWGMRPGPVWFGSRLNALQSIKKTGAGELWPVADAARDVRSWAWWKEVRRSSWKSTAALPKTKLTAPSSSAPKDAALVVLHYEGPRASGKQRSLLMQPEIWIFGRPPSVESYQTWSEERPTADSVQEEGLVRFIIRNYFDMLTIS